MYLDVLNVGEHTLRSCQDFQSSNSGTRRISEVHRFVLSIKSECLDRIVLLGERHLRRAIASYVEHYHLERCHQGIRNRLIDGVPELASGSVARRERLGGILSHYYREAA